MKNIRLREIDIATGIAIILVVTGHLSENKPIWYNVYKMSLYKFHMPFFMFISGFLLSHTKYHFNDFTSYLFFIKSKVLKFTIPYFFMSFLFLIVKYTLGEYTLKNELNHAIIDVFLRPISGPSDFLWYIYVLFQFYVFFPLIYQINFIKNYFLIVITVGIILNIFNPFGDVFQLNLFSKYFVFFSIGFYVSNNYNVVRDFLAKYGFLFFLIFVFLSVYDMNESNGVINMLLASFSLPALLYLSIKIKMNKLLEKLGKNTYTIYIWNSVFIFSLTFLIRFLDNNYLDHYYIYVPFLVTIGIFGPLLLRKLSRMFKIKFVKYIIP